jgi:hypothetical protein
MSNSTNPNEPMYLDEMTIARRKILEKLEKMSPEEHFQLGVRAGLYTPDGELTEFYANNEPSAYHPKD